MSERKLLSSAGPAETPNPHTTAVDSCAHRAPIFFINACSEILQLSEKDGFPKLKLQGHDFDTIAHNFCQTAVF